MSLLAKLWGRRRDRPALVATALVLLGTLSVYPLFDLWLQANFAFPSTYDFHDFGAYRIAVDNWKDGETIYRQNPDGGFWGSYLYPPVVLLLFYPFLEVFATQREAAMAWIATSGLALWLSLQALVAALDYEMRWWERLGLAWIVAGYHPVMLAAKMGQTALFMGAMLSFAGAALIWDRGRGSNWALVSGACTAVVGIVKFAYAPVGAHLLHDRRRLLGALLVVPPVAWLSIRFFGFGAHETYLEVLQWGFEKGGDEPRSPTTLFPPYFKPLAWFPAPQALRVVASLSVIALAVLAPPRAGKLVFALGVATFPMFTTQTYVYYLVALLPVAVILFAEEIERDGYPELVLLGLLFTHFQFLGLRYFVINMPDRFPWWEPVFEPHYFLLQPGVWGNALLFGLAFVRVAQTADVPAVASQQLDRARDWWRASGLPRSVAAFRRRLR